MGISITESLIVKCQQDLRKVTLYFCHLLLWLTQIKEGKYKFDINHKSWKLPEKSLHEKGVCVYKDESLRALEHSLS